VVRGLEDIGLEEAPKARQIAAVTRRYVESQETFKQMQACAANLRGENKPTSREPSKDPFAAFLAANSSTPGQQLIDAVKDDDASLVQALLQKGVNPNSRSIEGLTAFWWAAKMGHTAVVEVLLAVSQVKPDAKDSTLLTPLFWAVHENHDGVAKLLLDTNSVDVNIRSSSMLQRTPLHCAVDNGNEALVQLLLQTGKANVNVKDMLNQTPSEIAIKKGNMRIPGLLQAYKP
jgi:ankyrin repeat protein